MKSHALAFALFALAFAYASIASENTSTPRLVVQTSTGKIYPISGQQYVVGRARPFYINDSGEKTYITSIGEISIIAPPEFIDQYAVLADSYQAQLLNNSRSPSSQAYLALHKLDFSDAIPKAWPKKLEENDVFAIVWIQNNKLTPIYVSRLTSYLSTVNLTNIVTLDPNNEYSGYPALLVFRDGLAQLPSTSVTRLQFEDDNDPDHHLKAAALNGFPDYLAKKLPPKTPETAKLYEELLTLALHAGRATSVTTLVDHTLSAEKPKLRSITEQDLQLAIRFGHLQTALSILHHPRLKIAHPNGPTNLVEQTLYLRQFEIADALLEFGYKLDIPKDRRPKVLRICIQKNRLDYIEKLYGTRQPKTSDFQLSGTTSIYHDAAATATPETLEYLKQFDIPIDLEDEDKFTPLIKAAGYGNIPAVCWFLDNGARIDHRNAAGHTALQYSIVTQQAEATACLLQQGSDINMLGPEGVTPLMQAALFRDLDAAASIAQAGGIWNLDSTFLDHCLNYAVQQDLAPILKIAIEQGLSPKYKVYSKWPLDWLTLYYGSPACRALLDPANNLALHSQTAPSPQITLKHFDRADLNEILNSAKLPDTVTFTCLLPTPSTPNLVWLNTPVERFLENDIRTLITHFKFQLPTPTQSNEEAPLLILTAELNFQDRPTNLTDAITILNLSQIPNPQ